MNMKRCSKSFLIREIKIKTTMRYMSTLTRMPKIKKAENTTYIQHTSNL